MANILQQVQTYQMANLAFLQNASPFVSTFNTKFKDFQNLVANLGDTVTFELPPRFTTRDSLVVAFEGAEQRVETLTVDQPASVAYAFTAQQFIFNVEDYMQRFGKAATLELASKVESNVASNCVTAPFRFYGDGVTPINSYGQLAQMHAFFRNFGAPKESMKVYLSDMAVPGIINAGLNQFVMKRNEETANSWMVGNFDMCDYYRSNLLPIHVAGSEGQAGSTLTVVSVVKNADDAITQITFSGCAGALDADSIKANDKFQFEDGVAGQPNLRFRTFIGHQISACPVQFKALADAASTGASQVTVDVYPPLKASAGKNQNINVEIQAGMQVTVLPTHRAGMVLSGNAGYLAMPRLPDEDPYKTANALDADTGVSMRQYYGSLFGQNQRGMVHDVIWGSRVVPEYAMSVIFPL
jgi:hypothetical protein